MTMNQLDQHMCSFLDAEILPWPILICLLGNFRLMRAGQSVPINNRGKSHVLLSHLGLRYDRRVPQEQLIDVLWPTSEFAQARRSLNNLVYSLHKLLGDALDGAMPVLHEDGYYRLNREAGVGVDIVCFDALVSAGDQHARAGNGAAAAVCYNRAACFYRGDLCGDSDIHTVVERERLRNSYILVLAQLAHSQYHAGEYTTCLEYIWQLLAYDPCREDAHRLAMRCYVRSGHRAMALHQYQVCVDILRNEFDAVPEAATTALFNQIRLQPESL
jgi:DNA-binding SARP family transcriptional activator